MSKSNNYRVDPLISSTSSDSDSLESPSSPYNSSTNLSSPTSSLTSSSLSSPTSSLSYLPINSTPLLRELSFGVRERLPHGTTVEEAKKIKAEMYGIPLEEVVDNAETTPEFKIRAHEFLQMLANDSELYDNQLIEKLQQSSLTSFLDKETSSSSSSSLSTDTTTLSSSSSSIPSVLLISHGGFIKNFLIHICGRTVEKRITNCSLTILTINFSPNNQPSFSFEDDHFYEYNTTNCIP